MVGLLDSSSLLFLRPLPIMQGVHQSQNGTCVASCSSLSFCVGLFLGPALTRQCHAANSSSLSPPATDIPSSPSSTPFDSVSSPFNVLSSAPSTSHIAAGFHKLVVSGSSTHCPCQLTTGPVSSVQIHMSIVYTPLFTSSLVVVRSRILRMCGFLSSSTTTFPARTTFCIEMRGLTTLALLNVMHLSIPSFVLNGIFFSRKPLICSPFAATNVFGDVLR